MAIQFSALEKKGSFGSFRLWGSLGWAVAAILGGFAFTLFPVKYSFYISTIFFLSIIPLLSIKRKKYTFTSKFEAYTLKDIFRNIPLVLFIGIITLYGVVCAPVNSYLNLYFSSLNSVITSYSIHYTKLYEQASTALNIAGPHLKVGVVVEELEFPMAKQLDVRQESRRNNAITIQTHLDKGENAVFLTLGDPMLYSTYSYVLEYLDERYERITIPGIYSFAAISSLMNLPLTKGNDSLMVLPAFDAKAFDTANTVVCMKVSAYHKELYAFLKEKPEYDFVMITDAGKPNQVIHRNIEVLNDNVPYFSTAIIKRK